MNRARTAVVVLCSIVSVLATVAWAVTMKGSLHEAGLRERTLRIDAVRELLDTQAALATWAARQVAVVAAADPRPRAALSIEPPDERTLQDAADDVRQDTRLDWVGLCSSSGRVLAGAGPATLRSLVGTDLQGTPLFRSADEGRDASSLWFTADGPLVVTAAPVRKGASRVGVMLVGRLVDTASFERVASVGGGPVGLLGPHGEWAGSTSAPPEDADRVQTPSKVWPGVSLVLRTPSTPTPGGVWLPLFIVAAMGLAATGLSFVWSARRAS